MRMKGGAPDPERIADKFDIGASVVHFKRGVAAACPSMLAALWPLVT